MTQKNERQKAIQKVRKLRDRAHGVGSSEAEIDFAMRTMGEIMDTFDISLDEVTLAAQECKLVAVSFDDGKTFKLGTVTVAVANFCDCVTYYNRTGRGRQVEVDGKKVWKAASFVNNFYGVDSDAETAAYLMEMIRDAARKMLADFQKTDTYKKYAGSKLSLTTSFVTGFADRIVERLNDMKFERNAEVEKARHARAEMGEDETTLDAERSAELRRQGRSTDIVALKDEKVRDDFKKAFGWSVKYRSQSRTGGTYTGYSSGSASANNVNLNRPVGNGGGHSGQKRLK